MAVTPISPPVGEFPASTTPVRFTVDNLVGLVIAVDHSDSEVSRPVELVFADGVFLYPYLAASSLVGNTFSVLRQGGWASFEERNKVRIFEQPPAVTSGLPFGVLYDVNLAALGAPANQAIGAAGSYTIDGKTWWAKGDKGGNHASTAVVNGKGLQFTVTGSLGYQPTGDLPRPTWNTQILFLPLAQFADYNPLAPVAVMAHFAAESGWPSTVTSMAIGLIGAASDSAPFLAAARGSQIWFGCATAGTAVAMAGADNYAEITITPGSSTLADHCFGLVKPLRRSALTFHQAWSGDFPKVSDALVSGLTGLVATADATNLGVAILLNSQSSWVAELTRLQISQPKLAA